MTIGTRSLLFGAHQFLLHPVCVFVAWCRLYGFPFDPRVWIAILVHDWGYWGKPNMDGAEGETHPIRGARIMGFLFGSSWASLALLHSRHYARTLELPTSRLCAADKLGAMMLPWWVYLPMARLTGELDEYLAQATDRERMPAVFQPFLNSDRTDARLWYRCCQAHLRNVSQKLVTDQPWSQAA